MGIVTLSSWHASCDGCGEHVFVMSATRDSFVGELRRGGWAYNASKRTTLCPRCRIRPRPAGEAEVEAGPLWDGTRVLPRAEGEGAAGA